MDSEARYWDSMAAHGRDGSVIDPFDRRGRKNSYIARSRNDALLDRLGNIPSGARVLDFGCGTGNITRLLLANSYRACGLDISLELLKLAAADVSPRMPVAVFDGHRIPLARDSIDAAVTYVVLNHIPGSESLLGILREIHRVLRPGGRLIAIEQIRRRDAYDTILHSHRRQPQTFLSLFKQAGLELDEYKTLRFGHYLPLYLIRYGLIPTAWEHAIMTFEKWLGSVHPIPWFGYADVLFALHKPH